MFHLLHEHVKNTFDSGQIRHVSVFADSPGRVGDNNRLPRWVAPRLGGHLPQKTNISNLTTIESIYICEECILVGLL